MPALADRRTTLSYADLHLNAERLAQGLRAQGVKRGDVVAVLTDRKLEVIVCMIAIWRIGGVYFPLEAAAPLDRINFLLRDSATALLLTGSGKDARSLDGVPTYPITPVRPEGWDGEKLATQVAVDPPDGQVAYVIYTSGTTGEPKGVCVSHGALTAHLRAVAARFGLREDDRVLQFAAPHVDVALEQCLAALWAGAMVVVHDDDVPSTQEFLDSVGDAGITVANLPASYWSVLAEDVERLEWPRDHRLRLMISGSDRMPASSAARWLRNAPDEVTLMNAYGPTEAVITATACQLFPGDRTIGADETVPIGTGVGNRSLHVLRPSLEPCPPGVAGELYIGGSEIALGYLGRSALTAERFVPDPFGPPGGRLYRTGDIVRSDQDGVLRFLGRVDDQVKIRGHRVEPGEVEAVLRRHPEVAACAVGTGSDSSGELRLIAYVVPSNARPPADELRAFTAGRLPYSLVPAEWVFLERLPLTADGELDRSALPDPVVAPVGFEVTHTAPRTPTEELLAELWADVLGVDRVSIFDNFFQLGGDSLTAVRVISRLLPIYGSSASPYAIFEATHLAGFAAELDERSRELSESLPDLVPAGDEVGPLSYGQQALWFMDSWDPGAPTYNVPWVFRLSGRLEVELLENAFRCVLRRHEILRSVFPASLGEPHQVVRPDTGVRIELEDVRGTAGDDPESAADAAVRAEALRPFDLEHGPLVRARLVRWAEERFVLVLVFHHLVWDEWSRRLFEAELSELYTAAVEGRPARLPKLEVQYGDYARWQREAIDAGALRAQFAYWERQLAGAPERLELPADRPRPAAQTFNGDSVWFRLPPTLSQSARSLSRSEGATPFMVLFAAFTALLHRYTGHHDIVVGTPAATRTRAAFEHLIGYFVNILPLRTQVHAGLDFKELLRHVREVALAAYRHQEAPFEALVDQIQGERSVDQMPLVQVIFEMHAEDPRPLRLGDVSATRDLHPTGTSKFDMTWSIYDEGESIRGWIEFNADLFDAETVHRMVSHYERLLTCLLDRPDRPIGDVPLLAEPDLELLTGWGGATGDPDTASDSCLHEMIAEQAARTPRAVAVTFEGTELTYQQLDREADRLADHLVELGVGPGVPVGLCLERSPELPVCVLGVLRAGGAYVPLDPDHPPARLASLVDETGAPVVLTQEIHAERLSGVAARVVSIDRDRHLRDAKSDRRSHARTDPEDPVYVMYTSGSTGRPKGVVIPHRAVSARVRGMQELWPLTASDVVLQKTMSTFDVSVWELLWPLVTGARMVLARPGGQRDNAYLVDLIAREGVTTVHFVPSALRYFLQQPGLAAASSLRRVFCGGESLPAAVRDQFFERFRDVELHHLYGPTETCIDVTYGRCLPGHRGRSVPIGRPVAGSRLWVLDTPGRLAPVGLPGELYVGGPQLARGYLGRPGSTAERFVPDPFGGGPGERLYRTGDLVRWLPGGELEFLGRVDDQLKVRGHRIEPGEIEAELARHPKVADCAVVARDDGERDRRLVAYVVAVDPPPTGPELREFLSVTLPDHMLPAAAVIVEALPRLASGKLDRNALPEPAADRGGTAVPYAGPRSPVEELLVELWADVLGVNPVGIHDNFFTLGGDSFTAMKVGARTGVVLSVDVPTTLVFRAPTVAGLARGLLKRSADPTALQEVARAGLAYRAMPEDERDRLLRDLERENAR